MTITAAQWKEISARLKRQWVHMEFSLNGHAITITRERKSESTTCLAVYIDTIISGKWMVQVDKVDPNDVFMTGVVSRVWQHKFYPRYTKKKLESIEKHKRKFGAKFVKEVYGTQPEKAGFTQLQPHFGSSAALVSQYKKIDGLQLVTVLKPSHEMEGLDV